MAAPLKHAMSLQVIAEREGALITRALGKLRRQRLLITCRELADELERNRKGIVR